MPISLKGRHYVVAWIAVFLVAAGIIALRDRAAFQATKRIAALSESLQVTNRQLVEVSTDIVNRTAPGELGRVGERLGLRIPTDSEIEQVRVPRP